MFDETLTVEAVLELRKIRMAARWRMNCDAGHSKQGWCAV
jgi:hypothetical protein